MTDPRLRSFAYRYPPACWYPMQRHGAKHAKHTEHTFQWHVPFMRVRVVGVAWRLPEGGSGALMEAHAMGNAHQYDSPPGIPVQRYGWLLLPRYMPVLSYSNPFHVLFSGKESPEVSLLGITVEDDTFGPYSGDLGVYSPGVAGTRARAKARQEKALQGLVEFRDRHGYFQTWDTWPDFPVDAEAEAAMDAHLAQMNAAVEQLYDLEKKLDARLDELAAQEVGAQ